MTRPDTEEASPAPQHTRVDRYDIGELSKPKRLDNGYLAVDAFITRVGVFDYRNPDGSTHRELRTPDEVFHADALASFGLAPLTNGHPPEMLTAKNTKRFQVGTVGEVRRHDSRVAARLLLTDEQAIADALKGRRELSCGYSAESDPTPGVTQGIDGVPDGLHYDSIQKNIRGNHVALVDRGRAGSSVAMRLDSINGSVVHVEHNGGGERMQVIKLDGVDFEVSEQAHQAITKAIAKLDAEISTHGDVVSKEKARADKAEEDLAATKKLHADASAPETVAKLVKARVALEQTAAKVLGSTAEIKLDEATDSEIKRAVVLKVSPAAKTKLDTSDAVYLDARFDAALEGFKADEEAASGDALAAVRGSRPVPGRETRIDAEAARKAMLDRNYKAGRDAIAPVHTA